MPATPFADLPLDPDRTRTYEADQVEPRVRRWASRDGSGDPDTIDFDKFRRAFLWYDSSAPDLVGSYRLKIGDVVDGRLVAVWRGIATIAGVLQGARGGTTIPEADVPGVRAEVARYYAKARELFEDPGIEVPWAGRSAGEQPGREVLYRSFQSDLEVRAGGDGRTVYGIAVPWDYVQQIDDRMAEVWRSGAFDHQFRAAHRIRFAREHVDLGGVMIGGTQTLRNDSAGLYGEWRVSRTPAGDETLELVKDGWLRELSIGFRRRMDRPLPGGVVERLRADLFEVAVVTEGAFGTAATAAGVRSVPVGGESSNLWQAEQVLAKLPQLPTVGA